MGELTDVERPRLGDDVYQHPLQPLALGTDPQDGLPRPVSSVSMTDSVAPSLSLETFVCMGDESVFVKRNEWGEITLRVMPDQVRYNCSLGEYRGHLSAEEMYAWSRTTNRAGDVTVEPLRPQCQHYKRVMTPFENDPVIRQVTRMCSAQRGEGGEYLSLSDQQVLACEHRFPRDFVSEERLRQFDAARISEGRKTVEEWEPP